MSAEYKIGKSSEGKPLPVSLAILLKQKQIKGENAMVFHVKNDGFHGELFEPAENQYPGKALIVWGGSEGRFALSQMLAKLFSDNGITSMALAFFNVEGLPDKLTEVPMESVENAALYLKEHGYAKIGVWGISMGAELALLSGVYMPELISCVIAASPICVISQGLDIRKFAAYEGSLFTWRGKQLPGVVNYDPEIVRHSKGLVLKQFLKKRELSVSFFYDDIVKNIKEDALIPAEKINGPVLFISGGLDSMWPSAQSAQLLMERMERRGHAFERKHLFYEYGSHYMVPLQLKTEKIFRAERKYPRESDRYKEDMLKEMLDFLKRW